MAASFRRKAREWRAWCHRRLHGRTRWIAITGSVGKTTTARLVAAVLGTQGPLVDGAVVSLPNSGQLACRTILAVRRRHRCAVLELSAHAGTASLERSIAILRPDVAIITAVGGDHRKTFGSLAATARAKGAAVRGLRPGGTAILNADDPLVWGLRDGLTARVLGFGRSPEAALRLEAASARWPGHLTLTVRHGDAVEQVRTRLLGLSATVPVLAALAAGLAEGMTLAAAARALEAVEPVEGRMSPTLTPDGITFVDNAWKSPLHIVPGSLAFLREAAAPRKVVVFGAVSDFAGGSGIRYRGLAREALAVADIVVFSGSWGATVAKVEAPPGKLLLIFESTAATEAGLRPLLRPGDLVLLQGSCRMDHFERIVFDRIAPVSCWSSSCRRIQRCRDCAKLYAPPAAPGAGGRRLAGEA